MPLASSNMRTTKSKSTKSNFQAKEYRAGILRITVKRSRYRLEL